MLSNAVAQTLRACGRTLPIANSVPLAGPNSSTSRVLARGSFLIARSYKARVATRGYATASATATKKAPAAKSNRSRIAPADSRRQKAVATKAKPKAKAKTATKTKAKAKAKPKAKKATKKVVKKKKSGPAKRVVSPEKKALLEKRALRKVAMLYGEPKKEAASVWITYVAEQIKNEDVGSGQNFGEIMKRLSVNFKNISASEKSRVEQKALENKATNAANYKKWVESHTVEQIYKANLARSRLARVYTVKTRKIIDERMPKRPVSAFAIYVKARMKDSSVQGMTMLEAVKSLSATWKSLSAAEKKPYEDLTVADKSRYLKEMEGTGLPTPQMA